MKRSTRRWLFFVAFILFLMFGYIAIFYAQGYKYSFTDGRFFRTGAIQLKVNTHAKVYLDDKLVGSTSFIGNSFSRGGLLPGKYNLRINQDGYSMWQKKVTVQEGFITDFPKIMILSEKEYDGAELVVEVENLLYPSPLASPATSVKPSATAVLTPAPLPNSVLTQDFNVKNKILYNNTKTTSEMIDKNVLGFIVSKDESRIVWWNSQNEIWVMWLKNTGYQPFHESGDKELVTRFSTKIRNIAFFRGADHIVADSLGYKIIETDTRGGINIIKL